MNFFKRIFRKSNNDKLDKSLEKTSSSFIEKIKKVVVGKTKVDATTLDDLEEVLITSFNYMHRPQGWWKHLKSWCSQYQKNECH